jgi:MarR family transcriptional regulator, organic hydroperoxide resistance regulator
MAPQSTTLTVTGRIQWLSDLIRLEIALWDRIDARLRAEHDLPLSFFESLFFIGHSRDGSLQVGELARALRITVGGTSKVVDRIEAAGLIRREAAADDRRACNLLLTRAGKRALASASETYEAEMATVLDATLSRDQQHRLHNLVTRLLTAIDNGEPA